MVLGVPVERTWSTNDVASGALLNANLRDGINFLANVPVFSGYSTTGQSFASGTWTARTLDTNLYDTYNGHSTSTNNTRYTAQVAGIYLIAGTVGFDGSNTTGARAVAISYNGGGWSSIRPQTAGAPGPGFCVVPVFGFQQMAVNDYVEIIGWQSSGGALNATAGTMQAFWMHA